MQTLHVIISFKYEDKYIKTTWRNSAHIVQKWPSIWCSRNSIPKYKNNWLLNQQELVDPLQTDQAGNERGRRSRNIKADRIAQARVESERENEKAREKRQSARGDECWDVQESN